MLTTKTFTTVIPAPRPAVWAYMSDPRQEHPQRRVIETVEERPGWLRMTLRAKLLGMPMRVTYETARYDPPATITVITTDIATRIRRWLLASPERDTWTLTEDGDGVTRIERTVQLRHLLPGDSRLASAQIRRQLRQVANALTG